MSRYDALKRRKTFVVPPSGGWLRSSSLTAWRRNYKRFS